MKEYGFTMVFAGTPKDDDTILHALLHFESPKHMKRFQEDEELTKMQIEVAGAKPETAKMTVITDEALLNFPKVISQ
jgi:hypothetical protein